MRDNRRPSKMSDKVIVSLPKLSDEDPKTFRNTKLLGSNIGSTLMSAGALFVTVAGFAIGITNVMHDFKKNR